MLDALAGLPFMAKIGLELFAGGAGPEVLAAAAERGTPVFADWKLHDIPATVGRAAAQVALQPAAYLSVHCYPAALRAAVAARGGIVAITTLTSIAPAELRELGVAAELGAHVHSQAKLAMACGCTGVVCSPLEVAALRAELGPEPVIITPGISTGRQGQDDHARSAGLAEALRDGATHVVVGRAVRDAAEPRAALERLLAAAG